MRLILLAVLFVLVGIGIGLLIGARRRSPVGGAHGRAPEPPPRDIRPRARRDRLVRQLTGGMLLLAAALIALGYAYYEG